MNRTSKALSTAFTERPASTYGLLSEITCDVEGFNFDLGAKRHAFVCGYAITSPA